MARRGEKRAHIGTDEEIQIFRYSLSPYYRDRKRTELAELIQKRITWSGKKPELEVLEKKITEYRNSCIWLDDEPWSLGESTKPEYGIPADATCILLELWKYSLEIGYPFTLRHAKWAARLHKVIVTASDNTDHWKQIQILLFTALQYADREQVSQQFKQKRFDTAPEDANLVIPDIEVLMLRGFDVLPFSRLFETPEGDDTKGEEEGIKRRTRESLYDMAQGGLNVAEIVHMLHQPWNLYELPALDDDQTFDRFYARCADIEDVIETLSIEQQRAYAIFVTCFSKGSKWDELSPEDYLEIIEKLAQLVSQHNRLEQILKAVIFDEKGTFAPYFEKVGLIRPMGIIGMGKMLGLRG